jgi:peptidoglycan/LPS O-acetylase OafA/YrhL
MNKSSGKLQILRGIACLMVVANHVNPPNHYFVIGKTNLSWFTASSGMVATWILFILSGYLMGKSFISGRNTFTVKGIIKFYLKRILKIVPLYYLIILISCFLVYPSFLPKNINVLITLFTFTANDFDYYRNFNISLWAISVLMQFYLALPLIYSVYKYFFSRIRNLYYYWFIIPVFGAIIRYFIYAQTIITTYNIFKYNNIYTPFIGNLEFFIFGFFMNIIIINMEKRGLKIPARNSTTNVIQTVILLFLFFVSGYYHLFFFNVKPDAEYFRFALFIIPAFIQVSIGTWIVLSELGNYFISYSIEKSGVIKIMKRLSFGNILRLIGNLSFGIYLWHYVVLDLFHLKNVNNHIIYPYLLNFVIVLSFSIILSILSNILIEKPSEWVYKKSIQYAL